MRILVLFTLLLGMMACGGGGGTGPQQSTAGYDIEDCGNGVKSLTKKDADGNMIEQGYILNGTRNGVWKTYFTGEYAGRVKTITSYVNGALNGPHFEISQRGYVDAESNYKANEYHGRAVSYKFGKPIEIRTYKENVLHGPSEEHYSRGGMKKLINFKDGKQHGQMIWYDEDGNITMEYEYNEGEKVSGGIKEK